MTKSLWCTAPTVTRVERGEEDPSLAKRTLCWLHREGTSWEHRVLAGHAALYPGPTGAFLGKALPDVSEHLQISLLQQSSHGRKAEPGWVWLVLIVAKRSICVCVHI